MMENMRMELVLKIIDVLLIMLMLLVAGFVYEILRHPHETAEKLARFLRHDIIGISKGLFLKPKNRYIFDKFLLGEMEAAVAPFRNSAFDIQGQVQITGGVPHLDFVFVSVPNLENEDLEAAAKLVLLKFRDCLDANGLAFENFAVFGQVSGRVMVRIFYAEFREDRAAYERQYEHEIRRKSPGHGVLRDEALEQEFLNVD